MSSLELNKIAAAILTAGVIAMLSSFIADVLTRPHELEQNVYVVAASDAGDGAADAPADSGAQSVLPMMAAADPASGEKVAKKCTACHTFEQGGANKIGPNLWDIVNRAAGGVDGFSYSSAITDLGGESWSYEALNGFLANPKDYAPGTKMTFAGLKKVEDRAALIAYMRSMSDSPAPMPTEAEIAAVQEAQAADAAPAEPEAPDEAAAAEAAPAEPEAPDETAAAEATPAEPEAPDETATAEATPAEPEAPDEAAAAEEAPAEPEAPDKAAAAEEAPAEPAAPDEAAAAEEAAPEAAAAGGSEALAMLAAADPEAGQKVARKCSACHTFDQGGKNKIGPNLYDVIGRPIASLEGFNYSDALQGKSGEAWTYENLDGFLTSPKTWAPGNKMTFAGLKKAGDRAALIAYLREQSDSPPALPE